MRLRVLFGVAGLGGLGTIPAWAETGPEPAAPAASAVGAPAPTATATVTIAAPAAPPELGAAEEDPSVGWDEPWSVILSVERLLVAGPFTQGGANGAGMSFGALVFGGQAADEAPEPFLPHLVPRLAADVVLPEGITLGALAGFGIAYGSTPDTGSYSDDAPTPKADTYLLGARLGAITRSEDVVLWGRVGVSHAWASQTTESFYGDVTEHSLRLTALDVEGVVVIPCVAHFAVTFGFAADIALRGSIGEVAPEGGPEPPRTRRDSDGFVGWLGLSGFI